MNLQEVSCGGTARSAVTHTSSANKTAPVSLVWSPPSDGRGGDGGGGQVVFVATVVQGGNSIDFISAKKIAQKTAQKTTENQIC